MNLTLPFLALCALMPQGQIVLDKEDLPKGWVLESTQEVNPKDVETIGEKMGARIDGITYQDISVANIRGRLNFIQCPDEKSANAVDGFLARTRGKEFVSRKGELVVEFANCELLFARKLRDLVGLTPDSERRYEVQMRLGCVDRLDYMEVNRVFNLVLSGGSQEEIKEITADWAFGRSIRLWTCNRPWFRAEYTFDQQVIEKEEDAEVTTFSFKDPPHQYGIPYVDVRATIWVKNAYKPTGDKPLASLLESTSRWPKEDIHDLKDKLTAENPRQRERLESILAYVAREIRFGGRITGSRYGVEEVLKQGYGHCWDKSDVFVTLCRASRLPTRQIAGWVPILKAGHVWAEVYLDGEGWLPVDSTTPWTGTSEDYVPWFSTSDGEMPFLYMAIPEVRDVP